MRFPTPLSTRSALLPWPKASRFFGWPGGRAHPPSLLPTPFEGGNLIMKIRPLHDRVIVKRLDEEKKTASGIVIPDTAAEKPDQGEVTAVGKGKRTDEGQLVPLDVKVGDRVLFGKYTGQTVRVKGDELLAMREEEDRKSTRLNSSHLGISYAVFCLKKKINERFCEMLGYDQSELIGKKISAITHPDEVRQNIHLFERTIREGKPYEIDERCVRQDGS